MKVYWLLKWHNRSHHVGIPSANPVWSILVLAWDKTLALLVQSHLLLISPPTKLGKNQGQKQPSKDSDHQVFWIESGLMIFRQVQKLMLWYVHLKYNITPLTRKKKDNSIFAIYLIIHDCHFAFYFVSNLLIDRLVLLCLAFANF